MAASETGTSGIAQRYALALFELADEAKALDQVADDLRGLKAALADSADLRQLIRSPLLSRAEQTAAITAILEKAGASALTVRFASVVAGNRRLFALGGMITAYLAELARRRGETTARVTAAHALSEAQLDQLTDQLRRSVGAKVTVDVTVDPSLLGGLIVQVGSRMVDGSLASKLNRMQLAMKGIG